MQLLTIGASCNINKIRDRLLFEYRFLRDEGIEVDIKQKDQGNFSFFSCSIKDEDLLKNSFSSTVSIFKHFTSNAISDIIINEWEDNIIEDIIKENYYYFNKNEQKLIREYANKTLNYDQVLGKKDYLYQINRKSHVLQRVLEYLETNNSIIIEGFVNFRLKDYVAELRDAVDKAVDEYLMEKEYREFIKLLKYFVEVQEPKHEMVHIITAGNCFDIYDSQMNLLNKELLDDFVFEVSENDINYDDLLVSVLITIAPSKIVIHLENNKLFKEAVDTIKNIFDGKVIICDGCETCNSHRFVKKNIDLQHL